MLTYNMVAKANNLMIGKMDEPMEGRIEIAKIILEAAVEIVNSNSDEVYDNLVGEISDFGHQNYGMVLPDKVLESYVDEVKASLNEAGWDKRLLVKIKYFNLGTVLYQATLEMDLEGTVEKMGWDRITSKANKCSLAELVEDNPSMETINEINRLNVTQGKSKSRVPSYSSSGFVQRVQRRDR